LAEIPGGLGFILTGKTFSDDIRGGSGPPSVGDSDVYLAVFDASGTCVYQERHGGIDLDDQGLSIIITESGGNPDGFVIVGQKGFLSHDVRVLRYNMFYSSSLFKSSNPPAPLNLQGGWISAGRSVLQTDDKRADRPAGSWPHLGSRGGEGFEPFGSCIRRGLGLIRVPCVFC
jgi:hypothetical protein